LVKVKEIF